jgi:hypothetical protein
LSRFFIFVKDWNKSYFASVKNAAKQSIIGLLPGLSRISFCHKKINIMPDDKKNPPDTKSELEKQMEINDRKALGSNRKRLKDLKEKQKNEKNTKDRNNTLRMGHHKAGNAERTLSAKDQNKQNEKEGKDLDKKHLREMRDLHDNHMSSKKKFNKESSKLDKDKE